MIISDKGKLASLYHCNMLSLAAIEALCCDSNEVKSLLMSSTYLISHILVEMKQEISVCIKSTSLNILIVFKTSVMNNQLKPWRCLFCRYMTLPCQYSYVWRKMNLQLYGRESAYNMLNKWLKQYVSILFSSNVTQRPKTLFDPKFSVNCRHCLNFQSIFIF